jgi:hypothetical protein
MKRGNEGEGGRPLGSTEADTTGEHVLRPLDVAAGDAVSVYTPAGDVSVERGPVATLRLSTPAAAADVGVETAIRDTDLQLTVERATGVDTPVDVHLELPTGVALGSASTGRGDVVVQGVCGSPAIESDAGHVTVEGTDCVDTVRTNDGDATISLTELPDDGVVEVVDGDLALELAAPLDATLDIVARDGAISTPTEAFDEVALEDTERFRGTFGDGDAWLTAKTGDGDVTIELT